MELTDPTPLLGATPGTAGGIAPQASVDIANALRGDRYVGPHGPVDGNRSDLLVDTTQFVPRVLDDIAAARHTIDIGMFAWAPDGAGRTIAEAVAKRADEGLEVNIHVDGVGSRQMPFSPTRAFIEDLAEQHPNITIKRSWRPQFTAADDGTAAVDHRKIFLFDGRVAYLGGMNLAAKYDEWHDAMIRLEGPVAAQASAEWVGRWHDMHGDISDRHRAVLEAAANEPIRAGREAIELLANSPRVATDATAKWFEDVANAKERVWVLTPFIGNQEMVDALKEAADGGRKDVRVVVPGPNPWKNGKYALRVTRSFYPELAAAGVKIYEQPQMSHVKALLTDDQATVGSVNLDLQSAKRNYEIAARSASPDFTGQVEALFHRDIDRSRAVPESESMSHLRAQQLRKRTRFGI